MHMTRVREFVYRKVHPIKKTYQKSMVSGSSGKLPITNDDPNSEMLKNEEYHNQVKPAINVLRFLGMLPLGTPSDDIPTLRLRSPVMAYCMCTYFIKLFTVYNVLYTKVLPSIFQNDDFMSVVVSSVFLIGSLSCVFCPILIWLDVSRFVTYMKKWIQFQVLFRKVTGHHLMLAVRRRCFIYSVVSILIGIASVFFAPSNKLWSPLFSFFLSTTLGSFGSYTIVTYETLRIAGHNLVLSFKNDLSRGNLSACLIGEYRILWLRLSQLASETGNVMGKVTVFFLVSCIFADNAALYGCLGGILTKGHSVLESVGLGVAFIFGTASLWVICSRAHQVTDTIGRKMLEELELLKSCNLHPQINVQLREFIRTISMNPPVISALGFVIINKGMAKSHASATVSYMIVLLQFSTGQPEHECDRNATHNNMETHFVC